jgi:hypothetical protein
MREPVSAASAAGWPAEVWMAILLANEEIQLPPSADECKDVLCLVNAEFGIFPDMTIGLSDTLFTTSYSRSSGLRVMRGAAADSMSPTMGSDASPTIHA